MFWNFFTISLLSLFLTVIFSRYLESWAEGQGSVFVGTVRYGGAVGIYVICFLLLFGSYTVLLDKENATTEIVIAGEWTLKVFPGDNSEMRVGRANVLQKAGSEHFEIIGNLEASKMRPSLSFKSLSGVIHSRNLIFVYETSSSKGQQLGVALGSVSSNVPTKIRAQYYDVVDRDLDKDSAGRLELIRTP
tara:strand:+ start:652 stop:1221 length:570 start_codon:yes stop_codon:yes gene_type:complete